MSCGSSAEGEETSVLSKCTRHCADYGFVSWCHPVDELKLDHIVVMTSASTGNTGLLKGLAPFPMLLLSRQLHGPSLVFFLGPFFFWYGTS